MQSTAPHSTAHDLTRALVPLTAQPLCVGYSGGLDSSVLLHALAVLPRVRQQGLRAWHVHHGLQPEADDWVAHCTDVCAALAVPLTVSRATPTGAGDDGPEAAARHARHALFAAGMARDETLVFAHHQDDQAETFLLRALRGSGVDGLGAMQAWRAFGRGHLWRPLLGIARADLLAYANIHGLRWIEDPSNDDDAFDRNFLRNRVLPVVRQRWSQANAGFARAAVLCREAGDLLDDEDAHALASVVTTDPAALSRTRLLTLPPSRRARVLRKWIASLGLPPLPAEGVAHIESQLLPARADASGAFQWHGAVVHAWRDILHGQQQQAPLPRDWQATWDGRAPLPLPGGGLLALQHALSGGATPATQAAAFTPAITVRPRLGGERIRLPGRDHSHSLKQLLQDRNVPPWVRKRLPLLSDDHGTLLAAGDQLLSATFEHWLHAHDAQLVWLDA